MPEYIEREALIAFLEDNHDDKDWLVNQYNADWICSWIESHPAADVEPAKHGRWLQPKSGECFCSECKTNGSPQWKRCPVCEAKMDGGDAG